MKPSEARTDKVRVVIFLGAVACFFLQTGFVYLNYPGDGVGPRLSPMAKSGLAIWRENNCQACHQIYGYGGFLGPDLTNLMDRRPDEDWEYILTRGRKQMPAFDFDEEQQEEIVAFLTEVSTTGLGVPTFTKVKPGVNADTLVGHYLDETKGTADPAVLRGEHQLRENACSQCHRPFTVGNQGAPDLTQTLSLRSPAYVRETLLKSRGSMPSYDFLTPEQIDDMLACLAWMNQNRLQLGLFYSDGPNGDAFNWAAVPWFEY